MSTEGAGFAGTVKAWAEAEAENDELRAQLAALMDAFNDQAGQLQQAQAREDGWRKSYEDKRDAFNDQAAENERLTKQRDFAQEGWAKAEATIERLRAAIRGYVVAVSRAPNNRDEAEIDAASQGLVAAVTGKEQE